MLKELDYAIRDDLKITPDRHGELRFLNDVISMHRGHSHDELELNLVTGGEAVYFLQGRRYDLRRNTLIWLFPQQKHVLKVRSSSFRMWLAVYKPQMFVQMPDCEMARIALDSDPPGRFCRIISDEQAKSLGDVFHTVSSCEDRETFQIGLQYSALLAWQAYNASKDIPTGSEIHPAVEEASRLMSEDTELTGIEQIAAQVGMSAPYLSGLFKAQTGLSLTRYRNRQRLQRFCEIYGQGKRKSIIEAAIDAGFGSYPQFHRVFHEFMGMSPADYRKKLEEG